MSPFRSFRRPRSIAETALAIGIGLLLAWSAVTVRDWWREPELQPAPDDPGEEIVARKHVVDFPEELALFETVFWEPDDTKSLRELIRHSPLVKDKDVLEIGTGSGLISLCCAKYGANRVVATDINPHAVANARYNARRLGVAGRMEVRQVSQSDPGAFAVIGPDERFDLVISNPPWEDDHPRGIENYALDDEGFALMKSLLQDLKKHLKPGGRAFLAYGCVTAIKTLQRLAPQHGFALRTWDDRRLDELDEVFLPGMLLILWPRDAGGD